MIIARLGWPLRGGSRIREMCVYIADWLCPEVPAIIPGRIFVGRPLRVEGVPDSGAEVGPEAEQEMWKSRFQSNIVIVETRLVDKMTGTHFAVVSWNPVKSLV
jgi:hypothetical protein